MNANALTTSTLERADVPAIFSLGIDVRTAHVCKLVSRLKRLKSTASAEHGGVYREDLSYSQVHIDTTMTEDELDAWLYAGKGIDYVGVFTRSNHGQA